MKYILAISFSSKDVTKIYVMIQWNKRDRLYKTITYSKVIKEMGIWMNRMLESGKLVKVGNNYELNKILS